MYEYACPDCGARFEKLRKMSESNAPTRCPSCGKESAQRQMSTFAASGCGTDSSGRFV